MDLKTRKTHNPKLFTCLAHEEYFTVRRLSMVMLIRCDSIPFNYRISYFICERCLDAKRIVSSTNNISEVHQTTNKHHGAFLMIFYLFFGVEKNLFVIRNRESRTLCKTLSELKLFFCARDNELTTCDRYQREMETENLEEKQFSPFTFPGRYFLQRVVLKWAMNSSLEWKWE